MGLDDLVAALIDEAEDVETLSGREYCRNETAFAAQISDDTIEIRLGQEIAEAARRTSETHPSSRGEAWVLFRPRAWDAHAADRLEAWFRVAWRLAGEG